MQIHHIAGYKFIALQDTPSLQSRLLAMANNLNLKGTVLLSTEGINMSLAGTKEAIAAFKAYLKQDARFATMTFHETCSEKQPFRRLKVKIKKEIITLNQPDVNALATRAPSITPATLKQWLDEKRDITLLDTRNEYEVNFGTFKGALNLHINDFSHLPSSLNDVDPTKTIVMFCTGGIRCEKAALFMMSKGYSGVYQLDGGILGYFAKIGGDHYEGECFVFDERVSLDAALNETGTIQCSACQRPITKTLEKTEQAGTHSCPSCA